MASDSEDDTGAQSAAPSRRRVSGRARKAVERLGAGPNTNKKGKKRAGDSDDEVASDEEDNDEDAEVEDDDDEDDPDVEEEAPKKRSSKRKAGGATGGRRTRKARAATADYNEEDGDEEDGEPARRATTAKGDFKIADDNDVFNSVRNPNSALLSTADDWMTSYTDQPGQAMAELVNFVLRSSGCNESVDEHQAVDENGIVETLGDITEEFEKEINLAYPLVSRSKTYKKFRTSLALFLGHFYSAASASDLLYADGSCCDLFQAWITSLSSSKIRAFRHTATVFALLSISALNPLHITKKKEHAQAVRAMEAEQRKNGKKGAKFVQLKKRVDTVAEHKEKLGAYIDQLYEGIFINRYRDSDSTIRAECIGSLGSWMKADPDYWIHGDYLRYIGWTLSDEAKEVRRESVRALFALYAKDTHVGSLKHFTDRFKGQLTSMAAGEIDLTVRCQTITVLRQIEDLGMLDEEQRDEVAKLVFESERRVRNAAAGFFGGLLPGEVDNRLKELEASSKKTMSAAARLEAQDQLQLKVLAEFLVKYGQELDGDEDDEAGSDREEEEEASGSDVVEIKTHRGRIAFAVEALWEHVDSIRDWQAMTNFLLLDHSTDSSNEDTPKAKSKGKGRGKKGAAGDDDEEDASTSVLEECRLTEEEETLLVEVLVSALARLRSLSTSTTKKEKEREDEEHAEVTRAMIEALPRLFVKHQTVPIRVVDILTIPRLIKLDLYLDMRMVTAYEGLWDDVTKQFLRHNSADVLDQAVQTLSALIAADELSETNDAKMTELQDTLANSLRAAVAGEDIESMSLEADALHTLTTWLARIDRLQKVHNLSDALIDTDDGKQTSAYDIIDSLVERGRMGYNDEATMVEHGLSILAVNFMWQLRSTAAAIASADQPDYAALASLTAHRTKLSERLEEFSVGQNSNAAERVKQAALGHLLNLHLLCKGRASPESDPNGQLADLVSPISDEVQARCAGFIEAELDRRSEQLASATAADNTDQDDEGAEEEAEESDESENDDELPSQRQQKKSKKKKSAAARKTGEGKGQKKAGKKGKEAELPEKKRTAREIRADKVKEHQALVATRRFNQLIFPFVRAIHAGVLDLQHSTVILSRHGRFGAGFEQWCKLLAQDLRDEGLYSCDGGAQVAQIIATTLQNACELYLDSKTDSEEHLVSLGRMLVSSTVVRGAQLAISKRLPANDLAQLHKDSLSYIIKRIAALSEDRKNQDRNRALSFFKALAHLVLGLEGKAALLVTKHLDAELQANEVEVSATSKTWEPIRSYKKRLVTAMSKDPAIGAAAAKKTAADKAAASDAKAKSTRKGKGRARATLDSDASEGEAAGLSEEEREADDDEDGDAGRAAVEAALNSPAGSTRKRPAVAVSARDEDAGVDDDQAVASPAKRRRLAQSTIADEAEPAAMDEDEEREASDNDDDDDEEEQVSSLLLSSPGKRRRAAAAAAEDKDSQDEGEDDAGVDEAPRREPSPALSVSSQVSLSDIKRQRKKARR